MPCVREQELYCGTCGKTAEFPICCGQKMENDKNSFFCPICFKEIENTVKCCGQTMTVRKKVRNIRKEIFNNP